MSALNRVFEEIDQLLSSNTPFANDGFGTSVAIAGDLIVVGNPGDDDIADDSGAAVVFQREADGTWQEVIQLKAGNAGQDDAFGTSVAISDNEVTTIVVGSPFEDSSSSAGDNDIVANKGAAYVFRRAGPGGVFAQQEILKSSEFGLGAGDLFGSSVSISSDNTIIVGAPEADSNATSKSGAAFIFEFGEVEFDDPILLDDSEVQNENMGASVAIAGNRAVVGSPFGEIEASPTGLARVFVRENDEWVLEATIAGSTKSAGDRFGASVAINDGVIVVGAPEFDGAFVDVGGAFVFELDAATNEWNETSRFAPAAATDIQDLFGAAVAIGGDTLVVGQPNNDNNGDNAGAVHVFEEQVN